ncbi:MAG: amidohydrolase family protein [Spirochaetes bacterium]|nr:amidohydrolase family protein [Spirochaetota bacterium]
MRIIDMHGHHGTVNSFTMFRGTTNDMIAEMDRHAIELVAISSHQALYMPHANDSTVRAVDESDKRFAGYWAVNPNYADDFKNDIAGFEKVRNRGFIGFKFHPSIHDYPLDGENYSPYLEYLNKYGLVLLSHTWGGNICGFMQCEKIAKQYPDITFILGHSGYHDYERFACLARDHANVYLDTCAVGSLCGSIETMVRIAGSEKVLFGTDIPWFDPGYMIGCVEYSRIGDADKANIFYNNAKRILTI